MKRLIPLLVASAILFAIPVKAQTSHGPGRFSDVYLDNKQDLCLATANSDGKIVEGCGGDIDLTGDVNIKVLNGTKHASGYATSGDGTSGSRWAGWETELDIAERDSIYLSAGEFVLTETWDVPETMNITIQGDGPNSSVIYCDLTGAATTGTHDGGNGQATVLTDGGEDWTPDAFIGWTVVNITDGSSGTITDNDATTITTSAGIFNGTNDYWDNGDTFRIDAACINMDPA
ncbi:unnamed protein product, partial [marine sediment metagenome]